MNKPNILLIYTGGTIGMQKDYETDTLKAFDFEKISNSIPELNQIDCNISCYLELDPIDSSDMSPSYWIKLAKLIAREYHTYDGFVILHGSDTMSYTASALSFLLENLSKPIILTGSQLPIGDLRTDAKENLITSIQIAALTEHNQPVIKEVCLYFEYKLYRGNRTTKVSAEHFNAFESPNYSELVISGVNLEVRKEFLLQNNEQKELIVHDALCQEVLILKLFPGLNYKVLSNILFDSNIKGLILETYGSGNASTNPEFLNILESAIKKGIKIINVTQCSAGKVNMGLYETSRMLKKIGLISAKDMTTESAIVKLMYLLEKKLDANLFKTTFETSLRGEIS